MNDFQLTKLVNIDKGEKYDVYIGRKSPWGNPYIIGIDGDRTEVIRKYRYDFYRDLLPFKKEETIGLKGKILGCHCKPASCHGDVIIDYFNEVELENHFEKHQIIWEYWIERASIYEYDGEMDRQGADMCADQDVINKYGREGLLILRGKV